MLLVHTMWTLPCDRGHGVSTARQVSVLRGSLQRTVLALLLLGARADLSFKAFTRDPQGYASHIRLVDGSQIEYFSDEFNELCQQVGANPVPATNPLGTGCDVAGGSCMQGISQRFQHPQVRTVDDAQRADLPEMTYLDDGQLDNPYSGRVSSGNYTEVVKTKEFIPDGDLLPLPHSRTQLCHYGLRLTQPVSAQNSAAWSRFKQLVSYGFETEFHFRVFHRTKECFVGEWCEPSGADGFAFVVQNEGRKIVGNDISGNGYGFRYSLAVEFDMYRNPDLGELSGNHISVHVPPRKGEPNSADHRLSSIAYTDDIPPLQEGTHVVRIVYDVRKVRWDQYGDFDSDATGDFLRLQHSGRAGLLSVELDGRRVIVVPVDLSYIVNVDGTSKAAANTPRQPDPEAYDEKGASPGRAWVGFSSSTSYFQFQSVDILSWTFQEYAACPVDGVEDSRATVRGQGPEVHCIIRMGTLGRSTCTWDGQQNCSLIIQNAGRSAIKISAHTSHHLPHEYEGCDNGVIEWDALHPWFLGCRRTVRFTHELQELWITSLDGIRALTISDDQILQKSPVLFKRESLFQYCVMEHKHDPFAFYFAECNCEYCMRLLTISNLYNILYQHQCSARYGLFCPCLEASEVQHDSSTWTTLEPLRHMRIHICRGCSYTSHCTKMLKVATCEVSETGYQIGNPFAPTILSNGFINTSLDQDRVPTGYLRGDACNCEPQVRPYIGDDEGRSGLCSEQSSLGSGTFADLFQCANLCRQTARCSFLTYWETTQECRIYKECFWELCTNDYCFQSNTYRNEALGDYLTVRGYVQEFIVFPRRTLQTNFEDCKSCLHLYDHVHCLHQCGNPDLVPYLHWPAGQGCATCIFAGNRMHEMNVQQREIVKDCVYQAIRNSQDPWVACDEAALQQSGSAAFDLFNGVSTHFLSECPGRGFYDVGAVCVPNLFAMEAFPLQVLSRMAAINNTVWGSELQCLNAVCEIVPQWMCYQRWVEWLFNTDTHSTGIIDLNNTVVNDAPVTGAGIGLEGELIPGYLELNKTREQFLVTDPVHLETENATLEAWIKLGEVEEIKNMVLNVPASSNSEWSENYLPKFACDGIPDTYWSSQVGIPGIQTLQASLWLDLDGFQNGGAVIITWKEPAADYSVWVSLDNESWWNIITVEGNQDTYSYHQAFFGANFLRLDMTRAALTRGPGIDEGKPVFSIYELEVKRDTNVARLQQTMINNYFDKPASSAVDGDLETYWATEVGIPAAELHLDLGAQHLIMATKVSWRFRPSIVKLFVGPNPCSDGIPTEQYVQLTDGLVLDVYENTRNWEGRCLVVFIEQTRSFFGELYVGIREIELYTDGDNAAPTATINASYPAEEFHLTPVSNSIDGDASTYFLVQPQETPTSITVDLGAIYKVMSIEIRFALIDNEEYFASRFYTEIATQMVEWDFFIVDSQQGSRAMSHYFQVYRSGRYVRFVFEQVFGLNPEGRLGIEDFIIRKVSANLAHGSAVSVAATNSFTECSKCALSYDGHFRPHDGSFAVDDDFETWFGAAYGLTDFEGAYLQITFPTLVLVDMAAIRWKYPATDIFGLCSTAASGEDFSTVANVEKNVDYVTPVVFYSSYACRRIRLTLGPNSGTLGGEPVIGIREVEIYSTQEDITLNMPVTSSDGSSASFATDDSDVTVWSSLSIAETSLTIDTATNFSAWGARVLSPSTSIISAFDIQVSDDGLNFDTVYRVQGNLNNDLWIIERFSGRWVRFVFLSTLANAFYVRTLRVFATENLALGMETFAPQRWDHSGIEAVDGLNETIWLSEPMATSAKLRLDLGQQTFIAGGLEIFWLYPPTDFGLYLSNDTVSWELLWDTTGNLDDATKIGCPNLCYWESRYIEIRMTRASPLNGDGLYAIKSFNVYFDTNLAHFKPITATKTMPGNPFSPDNAIDGDESTFWMPAQVGGPNFITFDMQSGVLIAGFSVNWRRPPVQYYMEYEEANTYIWKMIRRWTTVGNFANVGYQQDWFDGFRAYRLRITVEEMQLWPEGRVCALTDLHLEVWDRSENLALNREVIPSEEAILGNLAWYAVDGNERGTYWYPAEGQPQAWIIVQLDPVPPVPGLPPQGHPIGRIIVVWRFPPGRLTLERQMNEEWTVITQLVDNTGLRTDWVGMRSANAIRLTIDKTDVVCDPPDPFCQEIGVMEIRVYKYGYALPTAVEADPNPWTAAAEYMVDPSKDTYWMGPPLFDGDNIYIHVDLGKIYNATDIEVYFGWRAQVVYLSMSEDGVNYVEKGLSSGNVLGLLTLAEKGLTFQVRYVTLWVQRGFQDAETGRWGTAIRDLGVLQFSNIVRGKVPLTNSVWEYPPSWTVDDDLNTEWTSRFGALEAQLIYDLGYERNVAGMTWVFGHVAGRVDVHYANRNDNRSNWQRAYQLVGNVATDTVVPTTVHFKCRFIRLTLFEPRTREFWDPDAFEDTERWNSLLSLKDFRAYEHTGGGGVLGFQSVDGMQYSTVAYGLRQPGEWILSSEEDIVTKDIHPGYAFNDVGQIVHIAFSKQKVGGTSTQRQMKYSVYRNGLTYGEPYTVWEPIDRMNGPGSVRVVMGVRSSAHYPVPATDPGPNDVDPRQNVIHGVSHSPFFEGWVYNVTLFKNALAAEEVRGLYEAHSQGGQESGCHCYDACPTGANRFFPNVQVPCSGQGACLRTSGQAFAFGRCECNPGYSGSACEHHCSELSVYGCCEVDDDCPFGVTCNVATRSCSQ